MVALWVRCSPNKHKNLSSDPSTHRKTKAQQRILVTPALACRDRKIPGACSPDGLANRWAPHSERDPVSRKKESGEDTQHSLCPPYAHAWVSIPTCSQRKRKFYRPAVMVQACNLGLREAEAGRLHKLETNLTYITIIRTPEATLWVRLHLKEKEENITCCRVSLSNLTLSCC